MSWGMIGGNYDCGNWGMTLVMVLFVGGLSALGVWAFRATTKQTPTTSFLRITPGPEILTYMVGYPVWEMSKRMESGAGRVQVPAAATPVQ